MSGIENVPKADTWDAIVNAEEVLALVRLRISLVLSSMQVPSAATGEWRLLQLCDRGAVVEFHKMIGFKHRRTAVIPIRDLIRVSNPTMEADAIAWFREGIGGSRRETKDIPLLEISEDMRGIKLEE